MTQSEPDFFSLLKFYISASKQLSQYALLRGTSITHHLLLSAAGWEMSSALRLAAAAGASLGTGWCCSVLVPGEMHMRPVQLEASFFSSADTATVCFICRLSRTAFILRNRPPCYSTSPQPFPCSSLLCLLPIGSMHLNFSSQPLLGSAGVSELSEHSHSISQPSLQLQ